MADLVTFFFEKVAAPLASGGLGVGATIWRMTASLSNRLEKIENAWKHFTEDVYPREKQEASNTLQTEVRSLRSSLGELGERELRDEKERLDVRRVLASLNERLLLAERRIAVCEKDIETLDAQWRQFAKEQGEQWQDMTRTLGQLEGWMKAKTGGSGQFPQTK